MCYFEGKIQRCETRDTVPQEKSQTKCKYAEKIRKLHFHVDNGCILNLEGIILIEQIYIFFVKTTVLIHKSILYGIVSKFFVRV
jgi:hypothetical protein